MTTDQQNPSHESPAVPTGNTYDKYGTTNPIEARLMRGFFDVLDDLTSASTPTRILEVGMGEGHVSARMIDTFPGVPFHGIDLPDPSLTGRWHEIGAQGTFADITRLPFPDSTFDLILAIEVLEHVDDPDGALAELRRVGTRDLVASVPREPIWRAMNLARAKYIRDLGNTPGHIQHWSSRSFEQLIARHAAVEARRSPLPWTIVKARFT